MTSPYVTVDFKSICDFQFWVIHDRCAMQLHFLNLIIEIFKWSLHFVMSSYPEKLYAKYFKGTFYQRQQKDESVPTVVPKPEQQSILNKVGKVRAMNRWKRLNFEIVNLRFALVSQLINKQGTKKNTKKYGWPTAIDQIIINFLWWILTMKLSELGWKKCLYQRERKKKVNTQSQ